MADEPLPPTLFSDAKLAEVEKRCRDVLGAASEMGAVVQDCWHLLQEVKAARQREAALAEHARSHASARSEADKRAEGHAARVEEIAKTANEHYAARQALEEQNSELAAEVERLRGELSKQPLPAGE